MVNKPRKVGLCGARVNTACQGTKPLRKTCERCSLLDESMETDYYPKTLKEIDCSDFLKQIDWELNQKEYSYG